MNRAYLCLPDTIGTPIEPKRPPRLRRSPKFKRRMLDEPSRSDRSRSRTRVARSSPSCSPGGKVKRLVELTVAKDDARLELDLARGELAAMTKTEGLLDKVDTHL